MAVCQLDGCEKLVASGTSGFCSHFCMNAAAEAFAGVASSTCARDGCTNPPAGPSGYDTGGTLGFCSHFCMNAAAEARVGVAPLTCARDGCTNPPSGQSPYCTEDEAVMAMCESLPSTVNLDSEKAHAAVAKAQWEKNLNDARPITTLVFLDVDGVLNCDDNDIETDTPYVMLNRACLSRLVRLVRESGAKVCLSSTWRSTHDMKADLWMFLVAEGLPEDAFVGQTPQLGFHARPFEIKQWMRTVWVDEAVIRWVVLDDMPMQDSPELKGHFVWVNPEVGLSDKDVEVAMRTLEGRGV